MEPWKFKIKINNSNERQNNLSREIKKIRLSNFLDREVLGNEIPYYLKDHSNSLNFNVSTALIETGMEAIKIFN